MTIPRNLSFLAEGASSAGVLSVPYGGTGLTTLTTGYIPFGNGTGAFGSSSNLFWDNSNNRLGINTTPSYSLDVLGTVNIRSATTALIQLFSTNAASQDNTIASYFNTGAGFSNLNFSAGSYTFGTSGTERMRIFNSGGVSIGNTTDPGATNLSVTGSVVGSKIYTGGGLTASTATATPVTIYTMPSEATIMITAYIFGTGAPATYNAVAIVKSSGSAAAITTISAATNMTLTLSGLNVQATQVSGVSQVINYQYTRLY